MCSFNATHAKGFWFSYTANKHFSKKGGLNIISVIISELVKVIRTT